MFEGLVRQLLLGYLGRYIKDFQKEQLKITLWNEEVLLENVELILEAFDYLQLPVALKRGRIGRLSIRIPWKKLGWDPIIILLEDVFFCASQREDHEWSTDAVERRELAAKKAKLAAAELAKLSRRVCDNQAGQSFISHVTGRILDSIQVSMRNVRVVYCEMQYHPMFFGLRFSSLTITKQNPTGPSSWKARGGQVNKIVEIRGLGIYCSFSSASGDLICNDAPEGSEFWPSAVTEEDSYDFLLTPFDVSFLVMKTGKLEQDTPQYSVSAQLTKLTMSINPTQLQHILAFQEYISTCLLRERYGRYRPWGTPLSKKLKGWQKVWWHYAQESVLSDVRKKLKKTSWRYLSQRLAYRRKYVNLYKIKLGFLQKEQTVGEDVLLELEQMEKESEIDDILGFWSIAEQELEKSVSNSTSNVTMESANVAGDKLQNDEPSSNGARGWLNWLSRGVLGAGGTDDSNHFSGVVSDEVIKDICEATKFQPMMTSLNDNIRSSITFLLAVNFSINQISLSMQSIGLGQEIAQLHLDAVHIQCKVWEDSSAITAEVGSAEVISLSKEIVVLRIERLIHEKNATDNEQSSASIQVNVSTQKQKGEILVKVLLQPLEVYCDLEFLSNLIEFFSILEPLKLQQERVLQSLNGIEDVKSRLLSKAECILSSRQKLIWDVNFVNVSVHVPWSNGYSKACTMVMQARSGRLLSRSEMSSTPSEIEGQYQTMKDSLASGLSSHLLNGLLIDDLYDHFEISINDFQTSLMMPSCPEGIALVEKVCASISLAFCIIPDEMILKQLEACIIMSSLRLHFSASIYAAICRLIEHLQLLSYKFEQASAVTPGSTRIMPTGQALEFCFSIATKLKLVELEVNLEDDGDNSSILLLSLQQLEMQYTRGEDEDCWVRLQSLKILSYTLGNECDGNILFSTTPPSAGGVSDQHEISNHANDSDEQNPSLNGCFLMHYESHKKGCMIYHTCSMRLKNAELHCYPNVVKLLVRFCSRLAACHMSHDDESSSFPEPCCSADFPGFRLQRFGQSNFYKDEYSKWESIPLDHFPFVTVHNCGSLCSLEGSLISPDWRKSYNLRDKIFSSSKDYNILPTPLLMFSFDEVGCHSVEGRNNITFLEIDLNVAHIMVHFHDSSCIVGSISLPVGKASVISHADCLDVLSSTEGLTFTSQWWASNCQEFLWGPLLPTQSPILNIRVRKRSTLPLRSCLEISFGIQHACCTLPPEYLAILIGYFNLPDWSSNESEHQLMKNLEHMDTQNDGIIVYKFEILDCSVISPVEGNNRWLLKLHSEQLCGSFIQNDVPENALNGVLSECLIPVINIADTTNSLNIFGRDVSLSLLLVEESGCGSFNFNQETAPENCSLIQSLSIDIWLRMPGQNESSVMSTSTYIMAKISSCDIVAEDSYCVVGLQALMDVIDHYSLVEMESRCYTCDVLQFFESKRSPKDRVVVPPDVIGTTLIEMKCYTDMLSVQLMRSERGLKSANMIARIDLGFVLSMFLENETISSLDVCFSSLVLTSLIHSFLLAKCSSSSSVSPVLDIHLSAVDKSQFKLSFSLSSLETWLYINDWVMVIDLLNYYVKQLSQDSGPGESASNSLLENILTQTSPDSESTLACPDSDNPNLSSFSFNMKSENIGISCHIPLWFGEEVSAELSESKIEASVDAYSSNPISCGKDCKFITVELNSRGTELSVSGDSVKFASKFNKTTGLVRLCESGVVHSWPFFQLCHLHVHLDVCDSREALMDIKANIQVEGFDIWLSDQVFYFWHGVEFEDSEANSFELTFGNVDLNIQLRKISILLIDGRWSCNGPLLEFVMRNVLVETSITESSIHSSVAVDLLINYNNIHKVLWEPFMETWKFQINIIRKCDNSALLDGAIMTDVHLKSTAPLNINLTAAVIEVVLKAIEMLKEAWGFVQLKDVPRNQGLQNYQCVENLYVRRYASYIVHNMTSLPFVFHVYQGLAIAENLDELAPTHEDTVPPGSSVPIYIDVPLEEQLFNYRPAQSADGLGKRQSNGAGHHFMTIQFEGISDRSEPISMDLVGLSYFEVNFSKDDYRADTSNEFLVPVVFDVSLQRYSKLIQLYSTVILMNSTSVPLEIRFDIPFGISSKVVDPVYPGQEFPLPLHLAEAGQIRWRPLGSTYLWSEAHNLSNILSMGNRSGFLRSLVCYPSHPSSNLFRCCLLVQDIGLSLSGRPRKGSTRTSTSLNSYSVKTRFIHHVTFCTPLVLKNYLPQAVSVTIESGGVSCTATLVEVETSFFHMDSSHDLDVTFCVSGFRPSTTKFPRAESFIATAKSSETLFSLTETIAFGSYQSAGSISVMVEKVMDALSGAREICISVPFLLYNCTGFSLTVSRFDHEEQGNCCTIPSCYNSREQGLFIGEKAGLGLVSSEGGLSPKILNIGGQLSKLSVTNNNLGFRNQTDFEVSNFCDNQWLKAKPFMYSPDPSTPSSEISVRVSRFLPECTMENWLSSSWSSPFFLVAPSGSATVFVPQPSTSSAAIISVSSSILDGPLSGKTRAITFHPKYVISNACSKDLCYKQKGTDLVLHLGIGQHSHLHWPDTTRELLLSVRFDEPGWQWSGSFLPDHIGDTQVKMRNYVSGALNILRVEVQNADVFQDEKIIGDTIGNTGTIFILLSDDDTGFIPYRIDNFSKETLRIYQQKCETLETIVHPYTSCPYAWDEPSYPHRLIVEVPGERILGSYALDDVKRYPPVRLSPSGEKHERTLLSSVHGEGAMKVLSVIDSSCHVTGDKKDPVTSILGEKRKNNEREATFVAHSNISFTISFIGISLIDFHPQELLYAFAKDLRVNLYQNMELEKFSLQISSLQIDNQLQNTPYPVVLSFDEEFKRNTIGHMRSKDGGAQATSEGAAHWASGSSCEPVICLGVSKWRKKDMMLDSLEHVSLRIADLRLELDLELLISLFDFFRATAGLFHSPDVTHTEFKLDSFVQKMGLAYARPSHDADLRASANELLSDIDTSSTAHHTSSPSLPEVVPLGAPWQKIYLLARRQNKIYVEAFRFSPFKITLSFSSDPWMLKRGPLTCGESLIHRGLMALADVEGAQICLGEFTITHHIASWESIQEILVKHYSRQFLHELYKVFGSAGVIGNPMGFARRVGLGFKEFLSVPARSVLQSPAGLITGMAQGTTSLLSNTLYAISDTATQFSKAAHKGILAFTFDDQDSAKLDQQRVAAYSQSKGVINELLEGLTGLLQSPIRGAEKHGLPGVLSGFALGVTGLVAKPAASVLEVTGRTAQSIRNRSKLHRMGPHRLRVRLPRPLSWELPLRPYSWDEAIGAAVLMDVDDGMKFKDETLVMCKPLAGAGKFVVLTERLILVVECLSLADLGKPEFKGIAADPEWVIEAEIALESVIHADADEGTVHIVGSSPETLVRQNQQQQRRGGGTGGRRRRWNEPPSLLPLFQTNLELGCKEEAEFFLREVMSTIELGKEQGWGNVHLLHQNNLK